MNLGGTTIFHYFDCVTSVGSVNDLTWEKNIGILRFPITTETVMIDGMTVMVRRMNLAPLGGKPAGYNDEGVYTCPDERQSVSINITGSKSAAILSL